MIRSPIKFLQRGPLHRSSRTICHRNPAQRTPLCRKISISRLYNASLPQYIMAAFMDLRFCRTIDLRYFASSSFNISLFSLRILMHIPFPPSQPVCVHSTHVLSSKRSAMYTTSRLESPGIENISDRRDVLQVNSTTRVGFSGSGFRDCVAYSITCVVLIGSRLQRQLDAFRMISVEKDERHKRSRRNFASKHTAGLTVRLTISKSPVESSYTIEPYVLLNAIVVVVVIHTGVSSARSLIATAARLFA